jgi:hypothetical protein
MIALRRLRSREAGIRLIAQHLRMQASEVAETEDPFADSEF